jgi:hypothetical protein
MKIPSGYPYFQDVVRLNNAEIVPVTGPRLNVVGLYLGLFD